MKCMFAPRLMMTLSLSILLLGVPNLGLAEDGGIWNPGSWLGGSDARVEKAKKRAEEARRKAEIAAQEANHAQKLAELAEQQAQREAVRYERTNNQDASYQNRQKPIVQRPDSVATPPQQQGRLPELTDKKTSHQSSVLNPLSLLLKRDDAESEAPKTAPVAKAPAETPSASSEKASGEKASNWKHWFGNSEEAAANNSTQRAERENRPQVRPDDKNEVPDYKHKVALLETEKGNIAFELYPEQAPATVSNFVKLVNDGFYNKFNMKFHRVVPGFVIQTGDPTGTGAGGSKDKIPLEAKNKLSHNAKGVVAMARGLDPNSASSQFYITLAPQASLDGKYAIFGRVIGGSDVLEKIEKDDMLYGIRLVNPTEVTRDPEPEKKKLFSMF